MVRVVAGLLAVVEQFVVCLVLLFSVLRTMLLRVVELTIVVASEETMAADLRRAIGSFPNQNDPAAPCESPQIHIALVRYEMLLDDSNGAGF